MSVDDIEALSATRAQGDLFDRKPTCKRFPSLYSGDAPTLTDQEVIDLLTNAFIIHEKLQGMTRAIRWIDDPDIILWFCDMLIKRHTTYDELPNRFILYEASYYDTNVRLPKSDLFNIGSAIDFPVCPTRVVSPGIAEGQIENYLNNTTQIQESAYSTFGDGGFIVISEWDYSISGKWDRYQDSGDTWSQTPVENPISESQAGRKRKGQVHVSNS